MELLATTKKGWDLIMSLTLPGMILFALLGAALIFALLKYNQKKRDDATELTYTKSYWWALATRYIIVVSIILSFAASIICIGLFFTSLVDNF